MQLVKQTDVVKVDMKQEQINVVLQQNNALNKELDEVWTNALRECGQQRRSQSTLVRRLQFEKPNGWTKLWDAV